MSILTPEDHAKYALEIENKYAFYIVGLSFAILAGAVQTARFDGSVVIGCLELISWAFLLASGLRGLKWISRIPLLHDAIAERDDLQRARDACPAPAPPPQHGIFVASPEQILFAHKEASASRHAAQMARLQHYTWLSWGIGFLALARAVGPAVGLARRVFR